MAVTILNNYNQILYWVSAKKTASKNMFPISFACLIYNYGLRITN